MACKAVLRSFAGAPRDGSLLDAEWRCRVCLKLPAEHATEEREDWGPAAVFGQKMDSSISELRKISTQLFKKGPVSTSASASSNTTNNNNTLSMHITQTPVSSPVASSSTTKDASTTIEKKNGSASELRPNSTLDESKRLGSVSDVGESSSSVKLNKFMKMLQEANMDMEALRTASWSGVPFEVRGTVWQLLLGYLPANRARRRDTLDKRRAEYHGYVRQFYEQPEASRSEDEAGILRQIEKDVPRTSPGIKWIQDPKLQKSLERMLYVWAVRHPASGYVQGINDLAIPFYLVFLSTSAGKPVASEFEGDVAKIPSMADLEADCFWCLSMLLDGIQDHYTFAQPGIQRMVYKLEELIARTDSVLYEHFKKQGLLFIQFAFRWMNCLLMREMCLPLVIRLWDTYLSEPHGDGFKIFHIYTCASFLSFFAPKLKQLEFQDLVLFLQNPPTQDWGVKEIEIILSQAYVLQSQFQNSPAQLK